MTTVAEMKEPAAVRAGAFEGVTLGTAVGDSVGLPREGLSARRADKLFGDGPLRQRLLFGTGMMSDDTEHTCMTAQALLASRGDPEKFARSLAWRLRWWLLGVPAGAGLATLRATIKLWLGFSPNRSGVRSAGNGPSMRAAVIGVWAADDVRRLVELVKSSTRLTHTHPAAEQGAVVVALAAREGAFHGPAGIDAVELASLLRPYVTDEDLFRGMEAAFDCARDGSGTDVFMERLGMRGGVSGWICHTVPAAVFCWLRWPGDLRTAVERVILMGGDTDTTGAVVGALVGATAGATAIPADWLESLVEWPRSVGWMRELARRLAASRDPVGDDPQAGPLSLFWPGVLLRNVMFLFVVLAHGFRRLLPPY